MRELLRYRLGFLGSWALAVVAAGLAAFAAAGELANLRDATRIARLEKIDGLLGSRLTGAVRGLRGEVSERADRVGGLRTQVAEVAVDLDAPSEGAQTILVSTAENRLWLRRGRVSVFSAVVSTGKGTTLEIEGRKMVFDTPTGRFKILSKEENPVWVPPDWHYVEEARKKKLELVRAKPGDVIDADTGAAVTRGAGGVWSLLGGGGAPRRVLEVRKDSIVEVRPDGSEQEVAPKEFLRAGKALVVPPLGTRQRRLEKTLGRYRLNLGDGYAIHGTQAAAQLGRSVSHGCVRVGDQDLEKLYGLAKVGDEVIIY
ncbi:MAG TPA: L,D-transpeptidase [Thermoanaerobaculia bacterium]|nr:L,D-transpeptidase [Thermoanaerobaculia bacterium]